MSSTLEREEVADNIPSVYLSRLIQSEHLADFSVSFIETLKCNSIDVRLLDNTNDLWIRDILPIQVGPNQFAQFSLTRDYYRKNEIHNKTDPAPICKALGINPTPIIYNGVPVYLDGGNIIRGFGKAIITEKVFKDNNIPREALISFLADKLQVEQIIIIPKEPYDQAGHSDGMVRFVDERTVVANDYNKVEVSQGFKDRFYGSLAGSGLDVLLVPYHPVNQRVSGLCVAFGCYINFLKVGNKIFLPTFVDPVSDEAAVQRFGEIFGEMNVIPVPSKELAIGGGVLNCCSWEILSLPSLYKA